MTVNRIRLPQNDGSDTAGIAESKVYRELSYFICDTITELPTANIAPGCRAFVQQDASTWHVNDAEAWQEIVGDAAAHPDLATHDALGLSTDTELTTHGGAADPHVVYQLESEKGAVGGYASLDGGGTVPDAQIPAAIARDTELHAQNHAARHAIAQPDVLTPAAIGALTQTVADTLYASVAEPNNATHLVDVLDAHDATAISILDVALDFDATDVEGALAELQAFDEAHVAAADPHTVYQKESEKGAASGYASLGADTLVPQDQLGTGVQDGSKFLRDDGVWAAPAGAPTPDARLITAALAARYTNSTTTGTEVTGLSKTLAAGNYYFRYVLIGRSAAAGTGVDLGINFTGTHTNLVAHMHFLSTGTAAVTNVPDMTTAAQTPTLMGTYGTRSESTTAPDMGATASVDTAAADMLYIVEGYIVVTVSGDLELWCASEAAAETSLEVGSGVIITKME